MIVAFRSALAVAGSVVVLLAAGACTGPSSPPTVAPTTAVTSESAPAVERSQPAKYDAAGFDVCGRTDLGLIADLSLTVTGTVPKSPRSGPGAACLFEMRSRDGHPASLLVEATTLASTAEAEQLYRATRQVSNMTVDGAVAGVGDEAEAFTKESEPGFRYSEYLVHARSENLVVKVWLAVGAKEFTAKSVLAAKSLAVLKATLALVPQA
ncbi:MAG TPA: hypothetical protein VFX61_10245 [Micromonosporaceae bacterium]|nr:hypothetical protein [Micromonosporaceae bacterium]